MSPRPHRPESALRSIFFLCLLAFLTSAASAEPGHQWTLLNPSPQSQALHVHAVVNDSTVFAAGYGGAIVRTTDGGDSWQLLNAHTNGWLTGAHFFDGQEGFLVGEEDLEAILLHTTDGGEVWERRETPEMPWLLDVDFTGTDIGLVVGVGGEIHRTIDGGLTWAGVPSATTSWLNAVRFQDDQVAVAVGISGTIVRSTDAGATWQVRPSNTTYRLDALAFDGQGNGVAVGQNGSIVTTHNGGENWIGRSSGTTTWLKSVTVLADGSYLAAGYGELLISTDLGVNWSFLATSPDESWQTVAGLPGGRVMLSGDAGSLWRCESDFTGWYNARSALTENLWALGVVDEQTAVTVGDNGLVLRTTDTGLNWTEMDTPTRTRLRGVDFCAEGTGYAAGDEGLVLKSSDGGLTWSELGTPMDDVLYDIACLSPQEAVAVGGDLHIWLTRDGGWTWENRGQQSIYDYHQGVHFTDATHGWTCTFYGSVYHTTDGGLTWELQITSYLDLQDIHFTDRDFGISVGGVDGNQTIITEDGGETWVTVSNPGYRYMHAVRFQTPERGFAVGQGLFRTTDGAATWEMDESTSLYLNDVCTMGPDVALVVGAGGVIMRAARDPLSPAEPVQPLPPSVRLQAHPNPFNPGTTLAYDLPRAGLVRLCVYDLRGRLVAQLLHEPQRAGHHEIVWRTRDAGGRSLASGTYFARLELNGEMQGAPVPMSLIK